LSNRSFLVSLINSFYRTGAHRIPMHLNQLETFLWVASLKSFHAAAARLNLTQPAISARIAALEAEFGRQLLSRRGGQVTLTRDGVEVMRYAQEVLRLTQSLKRGETDRDTAQRTIRIGLVETLAYAWVADLIKLVQAYYPASHIEVATDSTANLHLALAQREIDAAFVVGVSYEPNLHCIWLTRYPLVWLAAPSIRLGSRTLSAEALAKHSIITYEESTHVHFEVRMLFETLGIDSVRMIGCRSVGAIIELTRKGVGIGILPAESVRDLLARGEIRQVSTAVALPMFDVFACHPTDAPNDVGRRIAEIGRQAVMPPLAVAEAAQ